MDEIEIGSNQNGDSNTISSPSDYSCMDYAPSKEFHPKTSSESAQEPAGSDEEEILTPRNYIPNHSQMLINVNVHDAVGGLFQNNMPVVAFANTTFEDLHSLGSMGNNETNLNSGDHQHSSSVSLSSDEDNVQGFGTKVDDHALNTHENYSKVIELILKDWREKGSKLKVFNEEFRYYKLKTVEKKNQLHIKNNQFNLTKHRHVTLSTELNECLSVLSATKQDCEEKMSKFRHLNIFVKNLQSNLDKLGVEEDIIQVVIENKLADYYKVKQSKLDWDEKLISTKDKHDNVVGIKQRLVEELRDIKELSDDLKVKKDSFMSSIEEIKATIEHFAAEREEMQNDLQNLKAKERLLEEHIQSETLELAQTELLAKKDAERKRLWEKISNYSLAALGTVQYIMCALLPTLPQGSSSFTSL